MTVTVVEPGTRPPADAGPDIVEYVTDTDKLMSGCNCAASSDNPY